MTKAALLPSSFLRKLFMGRIAFAVALVFLIASPLVVFHPARAGDITFSREKLTIQLPDGKNISFNVEVATTEAQRQHGLMFRRAMPRDAGMLFLFDKEQELHFWMKNTYLPLDMLFVRADGVIVRIAPMTTPRSLSPVHSGEPCVAVIELNGGEAQKRGIIPGSRAIYPAFKPQTSR